MNKNVLITGATSGIGLEISKRLVKLGYEVYGIGRNIEKTDFSDSLFHLESVDICDEKQLKNYISSLKASKKLPDILIHSAGIAFYGLHEEINSSRLSELIRTNVEAPVILTQMLLRHLKEASGHIIFISSVTADNSNPHGCAYGATKTALAGFARSLFDESRKYGLKVTTIKPDMTLTDLYRNADFTCSEEEDCRLLPSDVADAVEYVLSARNGINISEIKLQPQKNKILKKRESV